MFKWKRNSLGTGHDFSIFYEKEGYDDEGNEHSRRYKDEMRKIRAFIQANHTDDTHSANLVSINKVQITIEFN